MKEDRTKDCLIDLISKEATIKNEALLRQASVDTYPYAVTLVDSLTGKEFAHCEMSFHYKNDTWHYTNWNGSVRLFKDRIVNDLEGIAKKIYTTFAPRYKVVKVTPLDVCTFF